MKQTPDPNQKIKKKKLKPIVVTDGKPLKTKKKKAKETEPTKPLGAKLTKEERLAKKAKAERKATKVERKAKVSAKEKRTQKAYVVALASEKPKQRISKINSTKMKSIMGDSAEVIQQLLESNDSDTARSLMYKKMLQSLVDLVPYAENNIRKTKGARGVYQLNSMITSIRELLIDVQSSQDRGRIGELLVERIVAPAVLEMGTSIIQKFDFIASDARLRMDRQEFKAFKKELDVHKMDLAEVVNKKFYEIRDQIKAYLQR